MKENEEIAKGNQINARKKNIKERSRYVWLYIRYTHIKK